MTILCIETSTSVCSAAVCKDGALIKQCISYEGSNHARLLPSYIEELIPMIDARRMEVYTMINGETKAVVVESEESLISTDETVYYFGDGAEKCTKVLAKPNWHCIPNIVPEAQYVGVLAERIASSNQQALISGQQLAYYEPFYLKEFIAAPSHVKGLV